MSSSNIETLITLWIGFILGVVLCSSIIYGKIEKEAIDKGVGQYNSNQKGDISYDNDSTANRGEKI